MHLDKKQKHLILHNIRSAHNVGSIFRTADAVGINKIFLTGYTPAPIDRFGRKVKEIAKVALGAEKNIEWESSLTKVSEDKQEKEVIELINKLKKKGFKIIAVEQSKNSVNYEEIKIDGDVVFIFGNEVEGLSSGILKNCDIIAEIPMKGKKESLNVSVAVGVALFGILKD